MANISKKNREQFSIKEKANRRLALLALTSKQDTANIKVKTPCPTSEEIALLVEKQVSESFNRKDLLNHISHCALCYEEWLTLSLDYSEDSKRKNRIAKVRHIFSNTRHLTAAGSALAIAASITIFLAIPPQDINDAEIYSTPIQKVESKQSQDTILLEDREIPSKPLKTKSLSAPVPEPTIEFSAAKEEETILEFNTVIDEPSQRVKQGASQLAPLNSAKKKARKNSDDMVSRESSQTVTPFHQFSSKIRYFCKEASAEMSNITELQLEGQELLTNKNVLDPNKVRTIEQAIEQLGRYKDKAELCQNLQRTLSITP